MFRENINHLTCCTNIKIPVSRAENLVQGLMQVYHVDKNMVEQSSTVP